MTSLWHAIWPGWDVLVGNIVIGLVTMPIMVFFQLKIMKFFTRKHVAAEVERQVAEHLARLELKLNTGGLDARELHKAWHRSDHARHGW